MKIDDTFNLYESGVFAQEEARQHENERIIAGCVVARDAVGKCLREIIETVLMSACDQIAARNYACTVDYQQRVEDTDGTKTTWVISSIFKH